MMASAPRRLCRRRPAGPPPWVDATAAERSAPVGDDVDELAARARVERDLLAHVQAGLRVAQIAHEVDDAVELLGLEGERPFVVAERERGDRVRLDVLVRGGGDAVVRGIVERSSGSRTYQS